MSKSVDEDGLEITSHSDPDKNANTSADGSIANSINNSATDTPSKTCISHNTSDEKQEGSTIRGSPSPSSSLHPASIKNSSTEQHSEENATTATESKSAPHVMGKQVRKHKSKKPDAVLSQSNPSTNASSHPVLITLTPATPPEAVSTLSSPQNIQEGGNFNPSNLSVPARSIEFQESTYSIDTLSGPKLEKPPHKEDKTPLPTPTVHEESKIKSDDPNPKSDTNSNNKNPKVTFAEDKKAKANPSPDPQQLPLPKKKAPKGGSFQGLSILDGLSKFMTGEKLPEEVESQAQMEPSKVEVSKYRDTSSQTSTTNLRSDDSTIRAITAAINKLKEVRHKVETKTMTKAVQSNKSKSGGKTSSKQSPKGDKANVSQKLPSQDLNDDLGPDFVRGSVSLDSLPIKKPPNPNDVKEWRNSEFSSIRKDSKEFPPDFVPVIEKSDSISEDMKVSSNDLSHAQENGETKSQEKSTQSNEDDEFKGPVEYPNIEDLVRPHRDKDRSRKAGKRDGKGDGCCRPTCCNEQFQAYQCSNMGEGDITADMLQQWVAEERSNCPKCELFEYILRNAGEEILQDKDIRRAFKQHMDYHVQKAMKEMKKIFSWAEVNESESEDFPEPRCDPICDPYIKCRKREERKQVKERPTTDNSNNDNQSINSTEQSEPSTNDVGSPTGNDSKKSSQKEGKLDKEFREGEPQKKISGRNREGSILDNLSKFMTGEKSTSPSMKLPMDTNGDNVSSEASDMQLPNDDSTLLAIKTVIQKLEARRRQLDPENGSEARSSQEDETPLFSRGSRNGTRSSRSQAGKKDPNDCYCWNSSYYYCHDTCKPHHCYGRTSKADARRYSNDERDGWQSKQRNREKNNDYNYSCTWGNNCNQRKCCCCMDTKRSAVTVVCRSKKTGSTHQRQRFCKANTSCSNACEDRNHYNVEITEPYWIQNGNNDCDEDYYEDEPCGNFNNYSHFYGCRTTANSNGNSILNKYIDDAIRKFIV